MFLFYWTNKAGTNQKFQFRAIQTHSVNKYNIKNLQLYLFLLTILPERYLGFRFTSSQSPNIKIKKCSISPPLLLALARKDHTLKIKSHIIHANVNTLRYSHPSIE